MKVKLYNQEGTETGEKDLNPDIFGLKIKTELIHQVMVAQMANVRRAIANTKTKGKVSGGGKKPWRQKGTGRARAGSTRSPLWRGGGTIFGPSKERVFLQKVNKKVRRQALLMCLSDKVLSNNLILIDKFELPEIKTKKFLQILKKLPSKEEKTLIVLSKNDKNVVISGANLPFVKTTLANNLNVIDLLNYKYVLLPLKGLELLEETYK